LRSVTQNIVRDEIEVGSKRHRNGPIHTPNTTRDESGHEKIPATSTVLFRNGDTSIALLRQAFPEPGREIISTLNLSIMGFNLLTGKGIRTLKGKLMLLGKFEVHKSVLSGKGG